LVRHSPEQVFWCTFFEIFFFPHISTVSYTCERKLLFAGLIIEEEPMLFIYLTAVTTVLAVLMYLAASLLVLSFRHPADSEQAADSKFPADIRVLHLFSAPRIAEDTSHLVQPG
jgi:hypothetical protein